MTARRLRPPPAWCGVPLALLLALWTPAGPLSAQTPLTAVGLGYPVAPVDGRAAALGGSGVGLLGGSFTLGNPADLLLHDEPGFALSVLGEAVTLEGGDNSLDTGRERFSTIRALVPFRGWAASLAFGGEFDQDWSNILQDTLPLAEGGAPYEETREHDGGISSVDLSLARELGPVGLGLSAQRLTGSLRQSFLRNFLTTDEDAPDLTPVAGARELSWRAWRFRAGVSLRVGERAVVGASFGTGGTLYATEEGSAEPNADFSLPTSLQFGGSLRVTGSLLLAGGGGMSGWSVVEPLGLGDGDAGDTGEFHSHDVTWMGGGLEYSGMTVAGGRLPLRLGFRRQGLPFSRGSEALNEQAVTGGLGWEFQDGLTVVDLAFESGSRGDLEQIGFSESFTRFTLSFSLRQR